METAVETKQVVIRVPVDLWKQVKIKAATDGETLLTTVAKALEQHVKSA
jgi:predicted HicB family RNase H-like nuclease